MAVRWLRKCGLSFIMFGYYKGKVMIGHIVYCSSQFGGSQYFTFS